MLIPHDLLQTEYFLKLAAGGKVKPFQTRQVGVLKTCSFIPERQKMTNLQYRNTQQIKIQQAILTFAMLDVTISGIGSVVSPIPRLITFAFGYFFMCSSSRIAI